MIRKRLKRIGAVLLSLIVINAIIVNRIQSGYSDLEINSGITVDSLTGIYKRDGHFLFDSMLCDKKGINTVLREGFEAVLENEKYSLFFNQKDGQIALCSKNNGSIIYSNPSEQEIMNENMLNGASKDALRAQFEIEYYDGNGNIYNSDSYNDSIVYGNLSYSVENDILSVFYKLGKDEVGISDVPQQISATRFERFLNKLSQEEAKELKSQYKKVTIKGKDENLKKNYIEKYPNIENDDIYYLQYSSTRILEKVYNLFAAAHYTADDLKFDNEENRVKTENTQNLHITVVLHYTLEENGLRVGFNGDEISVSGDAVVSKINLLPYFGCGSQEDSGYIMVPDGSGALMYFNNQKNDYTFSMKVYGKDSAFSNESAYVIDKKLSLPLFGIKKNGESFISIITNGEAFATVNAATSGTNNSFNYAYSEFLINASDTVMLAKGSEAVTIEKQTYKGEFAVEYRMTEQKNYIGMAESYREYLLDKSQLIDKETQQITLIDIICGATVQKNILGITFPSIETLTTYTQAKDILLDLQNYNVKSLAVRLEGWFNGGIEQQYISKIKLLKELGGEKGFAGLTSYCSQQNIPFFAEIGINHIKAEGNGFSKSKMNIRGISGDTVVLYQYDYVNRYRKFNNKSISQLTPAYFTSTAEKLIELTNDYSDFGILLNDISSVLYSDFSEKHYFTRQDSKYAVEEALDILSKKMLSASNPNSYALKNLSLVTDLPLSSSYYKCCDESIPFYQAVIHGYISYTCDSLNYTDDYRTQLLNAVEYGSGLQYTVTADSTSKFKNTEYNYLINGDYEDWKELIKTDSERAYSILSEVAECSIISHGKLSENLYYTGYSNGSVVYVNYDDEDAMADGITVKGKDFCIVREGKQ